jgi:hypothetical protein
MSADGWQAKIDGTLAAHFKQPDGTSRPGTDYKVSLKNGETVQQIFVRTHLAADLTPAARGDTEYQGQTVIRYVFDRLAQGWVPSGEPFPLPALTILNPDPGYVARAPAKRSLLARLFGK